MSDDLFGPDPEQARRAARADERRRATAAIADALAVGRVDVAAAVLDATVHAVPAGTPADPMPEPEPEPVELKAPTKAALKKAETARRREARKAEQDRAKTDASRKAKATVALVIDTITRRRQTDPYATWPDQPFAPIPGNRTAPPAGIAGSFLRARFLDDPALTPDEAAVAILAMIGQRRAPVRLMLEPFGKALGALRRGPYRTSEVYDRATGRGFVDVPLGETRFDPTDHGRPDLIDADADDLDDVPDYLTSDDDE